MSELPRYHKGKMGPVSFSDLNDVYERLDRLQQVAESVQTSIKQKSERRTDSFIVQATRGTGADDDKYIWREIIMQQDDTLLTETDDDFEKLSRRKQYRSGQIRDDKNNLTDNYATSIVPGFAGGLAMCNVVYPIAPDDGSGITAKYLLSPLGGGSIPDPTFVPELGFFVISSPPQITEFNLVTQTDNNDVFRVKKYKGYRYDPGYEVDLSAIGFIKRTIETDIYETMFDIENQDNPSFFLNRPEVTGTSPGLSQRNIDVGTVVTCH